MAHDQQHREAGSRQALQGQARAREEPGPLQARQGRQHHHHVVLRVGEAPRGSADAPRQRDQDLWPEVEARQGRDGGRVFGAVVLQQRLPDGLLGLLGRGHLLVEGVVEGLLRVQQQLLLQRRAQPVPVCAYVCAYVCVRVPWSTRPLPAGALPEALRRVRLPGIGRQKALQGPAGRRAHRRRHHQRRGQHRARV